MDLNLAGILLLDFLQAKQCKFVCECVHLSCFYYSKILCLAYTAPAPALKGQLHEIFDPQFFFHQSTPPRALIHGLKPFRIWFRMRRDNRFESPQNRFQLGQRSR
jgi:hypothetical protein